MGRKGEITRKKLLDTAFTMFRKNGYNGTSVNEVCREAGINIGNMYFHFRNKDELAAAVLEYSFEKEMPHLQNLMGEATDPLERLEAMVEGIVANQLPNDFSGG